MRPLVAPVALGPGLLLVPALALALGCSGAGAADDPGAGSGATPGGPAAGGGGSGDDGGGGGAQNGDAGGGGGDDGGGGPSKPGCVGSVPLAYLAPTDRDPHPATPPALGPAGSVVKDPTYGTSIVRLTDATTIAADVSLRVANEFWGNDWNTDATLFYMQDSKGAFLPYSFDPKTLVAARVQDRSAPGTPLKMPLAPGGFSRTSPNLFYGLKGLTVAQFDFSTQTTTTLVDLTTIVPGATGYALGVQQARNGLLAAVFGGPQQDAMPYLVTWDPTTKASHVVDVTRSTLDGKPVGTTIGGGLHSFKIDASGQYVVFGVSGGSASSWVLDTTANTVKTMASSGSFGSGAWVHGGSGDSYAWDLSTFASPTTSTPLVTPLITPKDTLASSSMSWQNAVAGATPSPIIVETMRQPADTGPWRAWDDELLAVRTDGTSSEVWRFAHTFNTYAGTIYSDNFYYLFIPRVSQNGWFVLFDSNWNGTLGTDANGQPRTDAFVAALPNACGP